MLLGVLVNTIVPVEEGPHALDEPAILYEHTVLPFIGKKIFG